MRVLVTGGAGFIGSHIVDRLLRRSDEVLVVDNMSKGTKSNLPSEVSLEEVDINDPSFLDIVRCFRPELITHCAAQTSVTVSMTDPLLDATSNIIGGINVCRGAVSCGCSQIIYLSTGGALYGPPEYLPSDEDHPVRPSSAYGLSKWTLERYMRLIVPDSIQLNVLRLANVYGPRQNPEGEAGVVSIFGLQMSRKQSVTIFGDGEQTRDYVYVEDVVQAHELTQNVCEPVTINISTGEATTVNELFRMMAIESGYSLVPRYAEGRVGELKHVVLSNSRADELLGWRPETSLKEGIRNTLDWINEQSN